MFFLSNDITASDLIDNLLTLDPSKRYNADTALAHDFFYVDPLPADLSKMLAEHKSMFEFLIPRKQPVKRPRFADDLLPDAYQDRVY